MDMKIEFDNHDRFRNTEIFEKRHRFSEEHRKKVFQTLVIPLENNSLPDYQFWKK